MKSLNIQNLLDEALANSLSNNKKIINNHSIKKSILNNENGRLVGELISTNPILLEDNMFLFNTEIKALVDINIYSQFNIALSFQSLVPFNLYLYNYKNNNWILDRCTIQRVDTELDSNGNKEYIAMLACESIKKL